MDLVRCMAFIDLQARKTNFHHMARAVIETARKSTFEIGASVLTTDVSFMPTGLFAPACDS
jgi:hypothetical protein